VTVAEEAKKCTKGPRTPNQETNTLECSVVISHLSVCLSVCLFVCNVST